MFDMSTIVVVAVEFFTKELSRIVDEVSSEFSQMREFNACVVISFELFICDVVEFELVRLDV